MKPRFLIGFLAGLSLLFSASSALAQDKESKKKDVPAKSENKDKLVVVWTSGDKEVAMKMVLMYTFNAKKHAWWKDITLLVWGPSAKLLSEDKELQDYIKKIKDQDITVLACKACADMYGVADKLENLGITVKYTGTELTGFIKERHVITF